MGKICAFLGNDYDHFLGISLGHKTPPHLKAHIRREMIKLIENEDVDTFLVGEKGGYEIDAYDTVLEVQKEYPQIRIYLVLSQITDLHKMGVFDAPYIIQGRGFDDFILPPKCEFGYKKLCIVYRNRYIIEHADFIIAYNKREGRAHQFCKEAQKKGVQVIELSDE